MCRDVQSCVHWRIWESDGRQQNIQGATRWRGGKWILLLLTAAVIWLLAQQAATPPPVMQELPIEDPDSKEGRRQRKRKIIVSELFRRKPSTSKGANNHSSDSPAPKKPKLEKVEKVEKEKVEEPDDKVRKQFIIRVFIMNCSILKN